MRRTGLDKSSGWIRPGNSIAWPARDNVNFRSLRLCSGISGDRARRRKEIEEKLANLQPPTKPVEGECCGNGCMNCVWLSYWENQEDFRKEKKDLQSQLALLANQKAGKGSAAGLGERKAGLDVKRLDQGSDAEAEKEEDDEEELKAMDVGMRAFLEMEKRLRGLK